MKSFLNKLGSEKLNLIAKIAMPLGIALLLLAIWGFVKAGHASMSGKNGANATLVFVRLRWAALLLGVCSLCGGFWLFKKSEEAGIAEEESENSSENDPLDFLK